ncbi:MAG: orotate phosphoribosyltransferase, partial [Ginsengibacter sp.]
HLMMALTMQDNQIANFLLDIKAVKINVKEPFVWTSGIKSPIYCDCRIVNSYPEARDTVINKFTGLINKHFISKTDVIAGIASGSISYGALIADRLQKPFIYVREKRKEYGLKKQIEGAYDAYNKVILIEDLISTGGSSLNAIKAIREAGLIIVSLLSIMTYSFKEAEARFSEEKILHESLCDLDTVLQAAYERSIIDNEDIQAILQFRESPNTWKPNLP